MQVFFSCFYFVSLKKKHTFVKVKLLVELIYNILVMWIVCADLEGVFVPEVWINFANKTGIDALKLTTRVIKD